MIGTKWHNEALQEQLREGQGRENHEIRKGTWKRNHGRRGMWKIERERVRHEIEREREWERPRVGEHERPRVGEENTLMDASPLSSLLLSPPLSFIFFLHGRGPCHAAHCYTLPLIPPLLSLHPIMHIALSGVKRYASPRCLNLLKKCCTNMSWIRSAFSIP